jgi:hypothetical protein
MSAGGPRSVTGGEGGRVTGITAARGRRGQPILALSKLAPAAGASHRPRGRHPNHGLPLPLLGRASPPSLPGCLKGGKMRAGRRASWGVAGPPEPSMYWRAALDRAGPPALGLRLTRICC